MCIFSNTTLGARNLASLCWLQHNFQSGMKLCVVIAFHKSKEVLRRMQLSNEEKDFL
jgi:hypothetical protein